MIIIIIVIIIIIMMIMIMIMIIIIMIIITIIIIMIIIIITTRWFYPSRNGGLFPISIIIWLPRMGLPHVFHILYHDHLLMMGVSFAFPLPVPSTPFYDSPGAVRLRSARGTCGGAAQKTGGASHLAQLRGRKWGSHGIPVGNQRWQWEIHYKWKFIAGNIIYKWRIFHWQVWLP